MPKLLEKIAEMRCRVKGHSHWDHFEGVSHPPKKIGDCVGPRYTAIHWKIEIEFFLIRLKRMARKLYPTTGCSMISEIYGSIDWTTYNPKCNCQTHKYHIQLKKPLAIPELAWVEKACK